MGIITLRKTYYINMDEENMMMENAPMMEAEKKEEAPPAEDEVSVARELTE